MFSKLDRILVNGAMVSKYCDAFHKMMPEEVSD